jgi:hypothetical protein
MYTPERNKAILTWIIWIIVNRLQTFQLSRFYRESPENSRNLPVSRFLSNSPDFSEYSGNIIKNYKYTVFSSIIVCLDLFWSCFMAIYRITYNNIVPICKKRHFRRLNFSYFFPEELDFNSLNSLPKFYLQWLECLRLHRAVKVQYVLCRIKNKQQEWGNGRMQECGGGMQEYRLMNFSWNF